MAGRLHLKACDKHQLNPASQILRESIKQSEDVLSHQIDLPVLVFLITFCPTLDLSQQSNPANMCCSLRTLLNYHITSTEITSQESVLDLFLSLFFPRSNIFYSLESFRSLRTPRRQFLMNTQLNDRVTSQKQWYSQGHLFPPHGQFGFSLYMDAWMAKLPLLPGMLASHSCRIPAAGQRCLETYLVSVTVRTPSD